ncbi:MAG: acyl carrier protein [Deltaproteobacteria bacterium]
MISEKLRQLILRELELREFEFSDATTAAMVPGWDSLSHIRVITAIEDAYNIRFSTHEIVGLKTLGDLQDLIGRKTG